MGNDDRKQMRSKTQNPNLTQFDGELIRAARDKKEVALYFTTDAILRVLPDITCIVTVVDRYMLKVKFGVEVEQELWIQKSLLAGVKVLP